MSDKIIGQVATSPAAQARAAQLDEVLGETKHYFGKSGEGLRTAWEECDLIISHLALGATTRLIADLLKSKKTDPAVVVVDEAGKFAIPLVGGHVGGANELARKIAEGTGAVATVTTATDGRDIPGLDTLGWATTGDLAGVTRGMLDGEPVELVRGGWPLPALPENVNEPGVPRVERRGTHFKELPVAPAKFRILVTDSNQVPDDLPTVAIHPKSLVLGMGCNRGTDVAEIRELATRVLEENNLSLSSVTALTSVDAKDDEQGFIDFAAELGVPFVTFSADELAKVETPNQSQHALEAVGTGSVSEASALSYLPSHVAGSELIIDKQKTPNVTVAVVRLKPMGRLSVVGLGPGADDLLTPRAKNTLRASAVVVGYRPYVAQIRHMLRPGTDVISTGMGSEEARIAMAIEKAREGREVSIVCSGDPAIYAMASPTLELGTEGIDVSVVPGVTAELAASSILGAFLGHDHVTLSLSDLHTSWDNIEKRLKAASEGDFVVALYNPRSHKRVEHLPRALEILGWNRPETTPVAVVQNATRPGENYRVATLADFDPEWVDMRSIVLVGSSTTRLVKTGRNKEVVVTPRDYKWLEEETK
ncbi:precorrin-3B C(17)-methyltransferase [Propionimicrobium lymphophilum]|uniref:precorrin-3B C(17)-methyltransferase n=1 Tax=Propionimicrobium lymphophilum TaxID=33012 RepID=UPI003EC52029